MKIVHCNLRPYHRAHEWMNSYLVTFWCEGHMPQQRQRCRNLDIHDSHAWQQSHGTNYRWCVGRKGPAVKQQCPNGDPHTSHRWRTNPPGDVWCVGVSPTGRLVIDVPKIHIDGFAAKLYGVGTVSQRMNEILRGEVEAMTMNPVGNQSKLDTLRAERERVLAELQRLERFPEEDPYDGDAVIYARLRRPGSQELSYAFLRTEVNGWHRWYSTGGRDAIQRATWTQLVEWLAQFDIMEWEVLMPIADQEPAENASDTALAEAAISELS